LGRFKLHHTSQLEFYPALILPLHWVAMISQWNKSITTHFILWWLWSSNWQMKTNSQLGSRKATIPLRNVPHILFFNSSRAAPSSFDPNTKALRYLRQTLTFADWEKIFFFWINFAWSHQKLGIAWLGFVYLTLD